MKQVNVLSLYELNKYVRAVAQEAGLSVQISRKGYSYLSGKTLYISPEKAPLNPERAMYQLRKVIHEVAHHTDTDMKLWEENPLAEDSPLRNLWNVVEDHRIEHVQSKRYDGDADILDAGTSVAFGQALKSAESLPAISDPKKKAELDMIVATLKLDRDARTEWMPSMHEHDIKLTPDQQAIYDKLVPHLPMLRAVRQIEGKAGTEAAYLLAKKMYEDLGGDPDKEEAEGEAQRKKQKDGKGDGKEEGAGSTKGEAEEEAIGKAKKAMSTSPQEDGENPLDAKGDPGGIGRRGIGTAQPALPQEYMVDNLASPHKSQLGTRPAAVDRDYSHDYQYQMYRDELVRIRSKASSSEQLAHRMRRLVQIRTRSRYQYGLKQGKLHGASLHRIITNVPGYSERVFKRKEEQLDIDSAVCVCVDMSGSMHGDKVTHAMVAAELLSDTVGNALGIPLMVYGFSECANIAGGVGPSPSIYVLREFTERQLSGDKLRERALLAISNTMGNNPDGDAVIWGYHQVRGVKAKRKILFVLSDGAPASSRPGHQGNYLNEVTKLIEHSPVKLFGVGLMTETVKHYYKNNIVLTDATSIESKLIELVDNFILQGN